MESYGSAWIPFHFNSQPIHRRNTMKRHPSQNVREKRGQMLHVYAKYIIALFTAITNAWINTLSEGWYNVLIPVAWTGLRFFIMHLVTRGSPRLFPSNLCCLQIVSVLNIFSSLKFPFKMSRNFVISNEHVCLEALRDIIHIYGECSRRLPSNK